MNTMNEVFDKFAEVHPPTLAPRTQREYARHLSVPCKVLYSASLPATDSSDLQSHLCLDNRSPFNFFERTSCMKTVRAKPRIVYVTDPAIITNIQNNEPNGVTGGFRRGRWWAYPDSIEQWRYRLERDWLADTAKWKPVNPVLFGRLTAKISRSPGDCWLWVGPINKSSPYPAARHGYITVDGDTIGVHRAMWIAVYGGIPDGLHVLHKCDVPHCIYPDHLWTGTHQQNMRDMIAKGRHVGKRQAAATHCRNGHPRNEQNCYVDGRGGRGCLICQRIASVKYHQRQVERGQYKLTVHYSAAADGCCVVAITKPQNVQTSSNIADVTCKICLQVVRYRKSQRSAA